MRLINITEAGKAAGLCHNKAVEAGFRAVRNRPLFGTITADVRPLVETLGCGDLFLFYDGQPVAHLKYDEYDL